MHKKGIDAKIGKVPIKIDPRCFRPAEVDLLLGDASKVHAKLGWEPKTGFDSIVEMMVAADTLMAEREMRSNG